MRDPPRRGDLVRLFFALWPDDATRAALAGLSRSLHERCGGRKVPEANLHLTLVFLGNAQADLVPALREMAVAVQAATIDLVLDTVGYWNHNRIVWVGAKACPAELRDLVAHIDSGVRSLGFRTETREYVPHMTLLRRARCGPGEFAFGEVAWRATDFALIQSAPRPDGVAYEVIARWPLAERA